MDADINELFNLRGKNRGIPQKLFILQLGCVRYWPYEENDGELPHLDFRNATTERPNAESYYSQVIEALSKHPNVFHLDLEASRRNALFSHAGRGLLLDGPVFSLEVHLPENKHVYRDPFSVAMETFSVLSNGSLFCAYTGIHNVPITTHIGHEFRELLRSRVNNETDFFALQFGPTPIHPNVYLAIIEKDRYVNELEVIKLRGDDLLILIYSEAEKEPVRIIFNRSQVALEHFYRTLLGEEDVIYFFYKVMATFSDLVEVQRQLDETGWYDIGRKNALAADCNRSIAAIYEALVSKHVADLRFRTLRQRMLEEMQTHQLFHRSIYFRKQVEKDTTMPSDLIPALSHYASRISVFNTSKIAVIAALFGAVAAALLTSWLKNGG